MKKYHEYAGYKFIESPKLELPKMKRTDIAQQIEFHTTELAFFQKLKTNCLSCHRYDVTACKLHGEVPVEFRVAETCKDWEYDIVPF